MQCRVHFGHDSSHMRISSSYLFRFTTATFTISSVVHPSKVTASPQLHSSARVKTLLNSAGGCSKYRHLLSDSRKIASRVHAPAYYRCIHIVAATAKACPTASDILTFSTSSGHFLDPRVRQTCGLDPEPQRPRCPCIVCAPVMGSREPVQRSV